MIVFRGLTQLVVRGTVQGVFFRAKAKKHADQLGLKGHVRNLSNGDVEIVVVGKEVDTLIKLLKNEPPPIQIDEITITTLPSETEYSTFSIRD